VEPVFVEPIEIRSPAKKATLFVVSEQVD